MNIKQLINFLQAQPDETKEIFVQNGNRAYPIVTAEKGFIFRNGIVVNTAHDPFFPDNWQQVKTETQKAGDTQKEVLLLVDSLDAVAAE